MSATPEGPSPAYVGRGGLKLEHALQVFGVAPEGLRCADFGCNIGGFTDCLLRAGASRVYAIDTGYGALAYRLRIDPRVEVMERTNALHAPVPKAGPVDLIVVDLAWTPQRLCIPAGLTWLRSGGQIISLIKPHYEATHGPEKELLSGGVLSEADAERVMERVIGEMPGHGVRVVGQTRSPILGGGSKKRSQGNIEFLALLQRSE